VHVVATTPYFLTTVIYSCKLLKILTTEQEWYKGLYTNDVRPAELLGSQSLLRLTNICLPRSFNLGTAHGFEIG
jgi:hypothetical protein